MGECAEIQVLDPLPERIKKLKGLPLKAEEIAEMKDQGEFNGDQLQLVRSNNTFHTDFSRFKKKGPYVLSVNLFKLAGRRRQPYTKKIKDKLNVFIICPKGKVKVKKKLKLASVMKPLKGKLDCGPYLVVAWIDLKKGPRIGESFYIFVPKIY